MDDLSEQKHSINSKLKEFEAKFEKIFEKLNQPTACSLLNNSDTRDDFVALNNVKTEMDESIKPINRSVTLDQYDKIKIIYPNTKIYRSWIPVNKRSWSIVYDNYFPIKYTSNEVISNINADIDILNIRYCCFA